MATTVSNATILGHNANATVDNGVALGSNSLANVDYGVAGYDPSTKAASTDTSATWKSTLGAVSVGVLGSDGTATATRQITGVAAGVKDTDAVNWHSLWLLPVIVRAEVRYIFSKLIQALVVLTIITMELKG